MTAVFFPFIVPNCEVDRVEYGAEGLTIWAHTNDIKAACPRCQQNSLRVHSSYTRSPRDLPVSEQAVRLLVQVRRFRCSNHACTQQTFAERLPDFLPVHAQRTQRLTSTLRQVAFALGGEAGSRLLSYLRMSASPPTLLRILRDEREAKPSTPRVLGVDDWALRKGRTYGTILVDLERHCPVDLLPDRSASTLARWLQSHPGVEIITRDRSTEYIRGATEGAPTAQQVADRWHLLQNMRQMAERLLGHSRAELKKLPLVAPTADCGVSKPRAGPFLRSTAEREGSDASRAHWLSYYHAVQRLRGDGLNILQITNRLYIDRKTVRKYFYAKEFPERAKHRAAKSIVDPYLPYLYTRLQQGCRNGMQLWREIQQQGYPGTYGQVIRWLRQHNRQAAPAKPDSDTPSTIDQHVPDTAHASTLPSTKSLAWLLMLDPATLPSTDVNIIQTICQNDIIKQVYQLAQQFRAIIQERMASALDAWLALCEASQVSSLRTFAAGIRQDYAAIRAALETEWSNGQTEGQVNRLKLLKRQMYGRAKFDLLRLRVLHPT
jgi:transposase